MTCRYEVTLNGVSLASLDPSILITNVQYEPPNYAPTTTTIANRHGARVLKRQKGRAAVTVRFMVRAYGIADRQSVLQDIISWARDGGDLRINDRPGQFLQCICDQLPAVDSVRDWTAEMSITFAAYAIPYWQEVEYTTVTIPVAGTSTLGAFGEMYVPGNAPKALVELDVYVDDDSHLQELWIETGDDIDQQNLNYQDSSMFKVRLGGRHGENTHCAVSFDENGIMAITLEYDITEEDTSGVVPLHPGHYSSSYLSGLIGIDEISVPCGKTSHFRCIGFTVSNPSPGIAADYLTVCDCVLKVRGLWE